MPVGVEVADRVYDLILTDDVKSTTASETTLVNGLVTTGLGNHHGLSAITTVGPEFELGLMLHVAPQAPGGRARKQVTELRLPPVPPRQSQGRYDFTHTDPLNKIVFAQDDWSGGGFQSVYDPAKPNRYATADGMDLRWANMAVPGPRLDHGHGTDTEEPVVSVGFLIRDPSFENATLGDAWSDVGSPTSTDSVTTDPRSGDNSARHARVDAASSGDGISQNLTNPTVYQGRELVFHMHIKKVSGAGGVRLVLKDNVGTTNGTTITATTYTAASVTRTIDGSATSVTLQIESTGDMTFDADDGAIIPTGGVSCKGTAVYADKYYGIFGRVIARYNGENGNDGPHWDAVLVHASAAATDIAVYGANVYVGFGKVVAYEYGSDTTWTTSTLTGDAKFAIHWTVSRTTLWKSEDVNEIRSSTNPVNGGSWGSVYTIGPTDREINALHSFGDTVIGGKEDGLWWYKRVYAGGESADLFINQTNEYDKFQSADNFSQGTDFLGWLWLIAANQSVFRTNLLGVQDITSLVSNPEISALSGRIRALTHDTHNLYLAAENGLTTTSARVTLISVRDTVNGLVSHPMDEVLMTTVEQMDSVFLARGTDGTRPFIVMLGLSGGGVVNSQKTYCWYIPVDSQSPIQSATVKTNLFDVSFNTSVFHGGTPHEPKALISATIITDDHTKENITLKFGKNGQDADATTAFTFSGAGGIETKYFEKIANPVANATGNSFQFQWVEKPDITSSPNTHVRKLKGFAIEMTLRPDRVRAWQVFLVIGGAILRNGAAQDDVKDKATMKTELAALENQVYPIILQQDFEQDGLVEEVRVIIRPGTLRQTFQFDDTPEGSDIWEAVLQEVTTS